MSTAFLSGDARLLTGLSSTTYAALGTTGTRYLDTVTVDGGAGNDRIVLTGVVKSAVINAGSGNDTLSLSLLGAARSRSTCHPGRRGGHDPARRHRLSPPARSTTATS